MLRTFKPFGITLAVCWGLIICLWLYLEAECTSNPACSGEHGILFVLLGLPWGMLISSWSFLNPLLLLGICIFINTIIIGAIVQLIFLMAQKIKGND